jgi:predicted nucleic acid-binding protein
VIATGAVLLDTSAIIDLERLDLGELAAAQPFVSAVSVGELAFGLDVEDTVERMARTERYAAVLGGFEVLPFDGGAAKLYGVLAALIRRAGRNPRPRRLDLQIAATAAANRLPLVTCDAADFDGLDSVLRVVAAARA